MKQIKIYLADLWAANIMLHNLHWNVIGFNFKGVHEYTEALYNELFEYSDEVAEYIRQRGEVAFGNIKEYSETTSFENLENKEISCNDAVIKILEIIKSLNNSAKEIADSSNDFLLSNIMEDQMTNYIKQIWFMESMLANTNK
ncbi:Dps family protein [Peptoniphilus senegalensis]|uniref:DNA starvation/stationary phase protection protein n=1 Tax=Peptoniphilus senegalensis TaxID=1465757 RepID=A0ABV1IZU2_9FIRM|nr:Antigen TpF1 [Peptoniphilus tyrrelliae]